MYEVCNSPARNLFMRLEPNKNEQPAFSCACGRGAGQSSRGPGVILGSFWSWQIPGWCSSKFNNSFKVLCYLFWILFAVEIHQCWEVRVGTRWKLTARIKGEIQFWLEIYSNEGIITEGVCVCVCGGTGGCHCTPPTPDGKSGSKKQLFRPYWQRGGESDPGTRPRSRLTFQPRPHASTRCPVNAAFIFDLQQKNKIALLSSPHTWVGLVGRMSWDPRSPS